MSKLYFGVMFLKSSLGLPDSGPSRREWQVLRAQNLEPDNVDFIPASPQANTYILGKLVNPTVPRFSCLWSGFGESIRLNELIHVKYSAYSPAQ